MSGYESLVKPPLTGSQAAAVGWRERRAVVLRDLVAVVAVVVVVVVVVVCGLLAAPAPACVAAASRVAWTLLASLASTVREAIFFFSVFLAKP